MNEPCTCYISQGSINIETRIPVPFHSLPLGYQFNTIQLLITKKKIWLTLFNALICITIHVNMIYINSPNKKLKFKCFSSQTKIFLLIPCVVTTILKNYGVSGEWRHTFCFHIWQFHCDIIHIHTYYKIWKAVLLFFNIWSVFALKNILNLKRCKNETMFVK